MPSTTNDYQFLNGVDAIQGYGDRWQVIFTSTWTHDEKWGLVLSTLLADFDVGSINFYTANLFLKNCLTFKNRMYIGAGLQFNFSDNGDPTGWEVQNSGAGEQSYLSSFGGQDAVWALSQLQGRLLVIARRSIQIWDVNADPNQFSLVQEIDNSGTRFPLAVQNIGDSDVVYLDDTGFRSARTMEVTLNAYVDDLGTPVDSLVQADLLANTANVCGVVDPNTKAFWCYLNGKIYVLTRYPSSQVQAWSTFLPQYEAYTTVNPGANYVASQLTGTVVANSVYKWTPGAHEVSLVNGTDTLTTAGYFRAQGTSVTINGTGATVSYTGSLQLVTLTTFIPVKFVIYNGIIYVRDANANIYAYGGLGGTTYDTSVVTVLTPWLDDKMPKLQKLGQSIDAAMSGGWTLAVGYDSVSGTLVTARTIASPVGNANVDSTFDYLRQALSQTGTHFQVQATTDSAWPNVATLSEIQVHYNQGNNQG